MFTDKLPPIDVDAEKAYDEQRAERNFAKIFDRATRLPLTSGQCKTLFELLREKAFYGDTLNKPMFTPKHAIYATVAAVILQIAELGIVDWIDHPNSNPGTDRTESVGK